MDTALFSGRRRGRLARLRQDQVEVIPVMFQILEQVTLFGRSTGILLLRNTGAATLGLIWPPTSDSRFSPLTAEQWFSRAGMTPGMVLW